MQHAIRDVFELADVLSLQPEQITQIDTENAFSLMVPREFVRRMKIGDCNDPLLRQVLPILDERSSAEGFSTDPVGDQKVEVVPGLLHKYASRVLLMVSGSCAVNCRYCFRRHYPYSSAPRTITEWNQAFDYIQEDNSIQEAILSGGDPLTLGNSRLEFLLDKLESAAHIQRVRIHTRFPVVIPQRIDSGLCALLERSRLSPWVVLHINHAQEIDDRLRAAIRLLKRSGASVLNQAVLLRGINDTIEIQRELCDSLVNAGVQPYYLHQLDRVSGATHFETDEGVGQEIIDELRTKLSGYAVPRLVREESGAASKTLLR